MQSPSFPPFHTGRAAFTASGGNGGEAEAEFKVAEKDSVLGCYDTLTPLYASFHEDDHTFSLMWTEYQECFSAFYAAYLANQERFGAVRMTPHDFIDSARVAL